MKSKEDVNISFKQGNTDERILKSISEDEEHQYDSEELSKAMNHTGLVQKEVQVQGKNGQTFTRKQWVRASEAQSSTKQPKAQEEQKSKQSKGKTEPGTFKVGEKVQFKSGGKVHSGVIEKDVTDSVGKPTYVVNTGTMGIRVGAKELTRQESSAKVSDKKQNPTPAAGGSGGDDGSGKTVQGGPKTATRQHWTKVGTSQEAKSQIAQMLASGKSREDCMAEFKSQGVTWKESDNAGINWMRAAMAMNKYLTSGNVETQDSSKGQQSSSKDESKNTTNTKKSEKPKSVIGSDYTQLTTEKESGTIEGEAHNMMVGKLGSEGKKKPTEKEVKAAANDLKDKAIKTVISSYNQDEMVHQLAMAKQFTKLAGGNMDHMTTEGILRDALSSSSSCTQEQKCNALSKLLGKDYDITSNDDVVRYAGNSMAQVHVRPMSKGHFEVTFSYDDGQSYKETYDSIKSVSESCDKFIRKEEKYAEEKSNKPIEVTSKSEITKDMVKDGAVFNYDGSDSSGSDNKLGNMVYKISKHLEPGDEIVVSNDTMGYIAPGTSKGNSKGVYRETRLVITAKYDNGNRGYTTVYGMKAINSSTVIDDEETRINNGKKAVAEQKDESWRNITDGALYLVGSNKYTLTVNKGVYK